MTQVIRKYFPKCDCIWYYHAWDLLIGSSDIVKEVVYKVLKFILRMFDNFILTIRNVFLKQNSLIEGVNIFFSNICDTKGD